MPFLADFFDNIGKNHAVGQLIAVNIFNFVGRSDHQRTGSQIIKEIKSVIKIQTLQQKIGHQHPGKIFVITVIDKILINLGDIFVAFQQNLVFAPFVIDFFPFCRRNNAFDDISITLRVYCFLISLDGQNQINLRSGNIIADIRQIIGLNTVKKNQKDNMPS